MTILSRKFEIKITNKNEIKNDINKRNPFHAIIPKRNSNSEKKFIKQKVILIKKPNNLHKNTIYSNNINGDGCRNKNLNYSKSETKCDTTSGISSVFSDRNIKQKYSKNIFEFTFSDINFVNNKIKNNDFKLQKRNSHKNKTNTNYSYNKKNNKKTIINIKKNIGIRNIKLINQKNYLNEKNIYLKNNKTLYINKGSFSKEEKDKTKNKSKGEENKKKKDNSRVNINKTNKTSKIPNKFLSLIPHDKNYQKKKKSFIKTNNNINNTKNIYSNNIPKGKDNNKIHKLLLNISPKQFKRINKSNPKLFVKHPTLKKFFDI